MSAVKLRKKAEHFFELLGESAVKRPLLHITFSLCLFILAIFQLGKLEINTTTEAFFHKTDPAIVEFDQFKSEFGRDLQFIISINHKDLFSQKNISELIRLHRTLEEKVPYIQEVTSLYNARNIYGDDGDLVVEGFFDEQPTDKKGWQLVKQKALAHPFYQDIFISKDGEMASIYIRPATTYLDMNSADSESGFAAMWKMIKMYSGVKTLETNVVATKNSSQGNQYKTLGEVQIHEMSKAIHEVLKDFPLLKDHIYLSGTPVITDELSYYLVQDMLKFIGLAILVIAIVLFIMFRSLWGVAFPLLMVVLALVSTMAFMSVMGQAVQSPTVILPSFVMAVGISNSIHLMSYFLNDLKKGVIKEKAIIHALGHCGVPIFFTIATTAAGLCSFGGSDIVPIANLGLFSAAGVVLAFLYTIFLLPALLAITPIKINVSKKEVQHVMIDWFIRFSLKMAHQYTVIIAGGGIIITVVAIYGAAQLHFSHDPIKWLPDNSPGRLAMEAVSKKIGGSVPVEVVIDTGVIDGVKNATFMKDLDAAVVDLEAYKTPILKVGKVISVTTLLKETNRALYDNKQEEYNVPASSNLIAQEFLMLETSGAEDLFRLVDRDYQKTRITVLTPWVDALYFGEYVRGMEALLQKRFGSSAQVHITGIVPMLAKTLRKIMNSTAISYAIAFMVITLMMIILLRSIKYGLISILPNILPITVVLALMHINGAPLDMFSMLIGSIAMGLAVDDTIHFMDGFRNVYDKTGNASLAVTESLTLSGRAMLTTSIILSLGFLIYLFSPMHNLQDFGLYSALCIIIALLADFWISPALILLLHRRK